MRTRARIRLLMGTAASVHRTGAWWVLVLWVAFCGAGASADEPGESSVGFSPQAMRGLVRTALPVAGPELTAGVHAGYGLIEPIDASEGIHRFAGVANVGFAPVPWLGAALVLDGRLDMHGDDGMGSHSTAVGDSRLSARAGTELSNETALGGRASLWFPGQDAPSFEPGATTLGLEALFAWRPAHSRFALLSSAGFRLDNSAKSAPDLNRLRPGDRVALSLSSAHAVLVAVGAAYRPQPELELLAELSADLLVGGDAPPLPASPMRATLGGRYLLGPVQLSLMLGASPSKRPDTAPDQPLVPIEPRFSALLGFQYVIDFSEPKETFVPPDELPPERETEPQAPVVEPAAATATLQATVRDDRGEPLPDARVVVTPKGGTPHETITDAEGSFTAPDLPIGPASVEVSAIGFERLSWEVEVTAGMPPAAAPPLVAKTDVGVLRGLTRSFGSEPLRAFVDVRAKGKLVESVQSNDEGRFELELPPGRYRVTIRAEGYKSQNRDVRVESNSVAILNVDLREGK